MKELQCLHSRVLVNVGDNPLTDCSFFSPVLLSPANETDIADISAAARFATGDSEAFVEGTTLLGEAICTRGENEDMRGENVANGLTLPTL